MGIKSEDEAGCSSVDEESYKTLKQQEEVFRNLDAQYEMARSQTHTERNGFGVHLINARNGHGLKTTLYWGLLQTGSDARSLITEQLAF